jgi:hypothetical protein
MFYARVMHNQIYFVIMPRNYVIGDSLKLYEIFPFFLTVSGKKPQHVFGSGMRHSKKRYPDESLGENFTIFIFHYALVFALARACLEDVFAIISDRLNLALNPNEICELLSYTLHAFSALSSRSDEDEKIPE